MNRLSNICLGMLLALLAMDLGYRLHAGTITKDFTFSAGGTIRASELNANFDTLYNEVNGNLGTANIASGGVATDEILDGTIAYADLNSNIDTLRGYYTDLDVVGGYSDTSKVTVTATDLAVTDGTNWIVLHTVSTVLAPSSATIALLGQDTTFAAAADTHYGVFVIAKSDGTTSAVLSQSLTSPNLTDSTFSGYTYYRLVSAVKNTAGGSWNVRQYYQRGSTVRLRAREDLTGSAAASAKVVDLANFTPGTDTATTIAVAFNLICTGTDGSNQQQITGADTTSILHRVDCNESGSGSDYNFSTFEYYLEPGNNNFYYEGLTNSGGDTVNLYLLGFQIDQLAR